jgi:hypothetical protein
MIARSRLAKFIKRFPRSQVIIRPYSDPEGNTVEIVSVQRNKHYMHITAYKRQRDAVRALRLYGMVQEGRVWRTPLAKGSEQQIPDAPEERGKSNAAAVWRDDDGLRAGTGFDWGGYDPIWKREQ